MYQETAEELFSFIESSPTAYHAVDTMKCMLDREGFQQLLEGESWKLAVGGKYYVIRGGSSMIAFRIPTEDFCGFEILASHSDSPAFKIKENPEMNVEDCYVKLNVEKYGGMLMSPWFDRPLSVAGRLLVREQGRLMTKLVHIDRDLVMIPNLAIHFNRDINNGYSYKVQKDMLPLYGMAEAKGTFHSLIAEAAGVKPERVISRDLYVYSRMKGTVWGAQEEFISIGRLDDLQCAFASIKGFLAAGDGQSIPVHCVFDNEEVGSSTKQGAASTFLYDTLTRINAVFDRTEEQYKRAVANSLMISADNGHALHPNYPEKSCPTNRPKLNGGIVIKRSGNQKYTTDAVSEALFREICDRAEVPCQVFLNHADIAGGSTLGNISGNQVAVNCVDIGLAQLSMHSPYETAGIKDTQYLIRAAEQFFQSTVKETAYGTYELI